jgi:hypothetical protein
MADKIPTFEWNSEESGKTFMSLRQLCNLTWQPANVDSSSITTLSPLTLPLIPDQNHPVLWMLENGGNYTKHSR